MPIDFENTTILSAFRPRPLRLASVAQLILGVIAWTRARQLVLMVLLGVPFVNTTGYAQSPTFEVASIKPAVDPGRQPALCLVPCVPGERLRVDGSRVDIGFMSLHRLILMAYRVKPYQLIGPEWMKSQKFDIVAKIPDGVRKDQVPEMLTALLAERFKLVTHRDSKEQQVYALVVGKNGPKLKESTSEADEFTSDPALTTPPGDPYGPLRTSRSKWTLLKVTMSGLAEVLSTFLEHPVVNMTNLDGNYQIGWDAPTPPRPEPGQSPSEITRAMNSATADAMIKAINEAGLKLEPRKAPVEMIMVDHLEKLPTNN
jgi:uncharacterized protein (TIGR03435 family)